MFKLIKNNLKALLAVLLLAATLIFIGCSSQDMDFIQPYQFINKDFDEVVELPPVQEEEPEVEEPEEPEIKEPEKATNVVEDTSEAESEDDVSEETKNVLTQVVDFVQEQEQEKEEAVAEVAEALDEDLVNDLLSEDAELDENILATASAAAASPELADLFPELVLPDLPTDGEEGRLDWDEISEITLDMEMFRIMTLVGPCATAANTAYETALLALNNQRTTNLNTIEQNFNRRIADAESRSISRNQTALSSYRARLTGLNVFINGYLRAAANLQRFSPRLASNLRYYALLYLVYTRSLIDREYQFNLFNIQRLRSIDISLANNLRAQSINTLTANYNANLATLQSTLKNALNNCHNQGTGN